MIDIKPFKIFEINLFYLIIGVLLLTIGAFSQHSEIYRGLLITEYLLVLLPTILFLKFKGYKLKNVLRLNKLTIKQIILIPGIVILLYPVALFFNLIILTILSYFDIYITQPVPIPQNSTDFLIGIFIIAISAGICEETMFRGLVMRGYERLGIKKAIVISSVLFGLFHFNIANLFGPIILGIVFGYIVWKTDSLFAGIIAHITNNAFSLSMSYLLTKININNNVNTDIVKESLNVTTFIVFLIFIGIIALFTGSIGMLLLKILPNTNKKYNLNKDFDVINKISIKEYIPIIVLLLMYIYMSFRIISVYS